jgi:hypothetical protein
VKTLAKRKGPGRPKKAPGTPVDHRLSSGMKTAIEHWVATDCARLEAAEAGGVTEDGLKRALKSNPLARQFYDAEVRSFVNGQRHRAAHALVREMSGPNAAARTNAAKTLLEMSDTGNRQPAVTPQMPGVTIIIEAPSTRLPPAAPTIEIPAAWVDPT